MFFTFWIYNTVLLGSSALLYLSEQAADYRKRFVYRLAAFVVVTAPAAFRYNIGFDFQAYLKNYHEQWAHDSYTPFYNLLNSVLNGLDQSEASFFLFSAIVLYGLLFLGYPRKNAWVINFGFIAMLYFQSLSIVRSTTAAVMVLGAILCLTGCRNNFKPFILWAAGLLLVTYLDQELLFILMALFSVGASYPWGWVMPMVAPVLNDRRFVFAVMVILAGLLFHISALFFLVLLVFEIPFIKKPLVKIPYLVLVLLIVFYFTSGQLFWYLFNSPLLDWAGFGIYRQFASTYFESQEISTGLGVLAYIALLLPPLLLTKVIMRQKPELYPIIVLSVLCCLAYIMSLHVFIVQRIYIAFSLAYALIPYLLLKIDFRGRKILFWCMMALMLVMFEKNILRNTTDRCDSLRVAPYVSIFNVQDDHSSSILECKQ